MTRTAIAVALVASLALIATTAQAADAVAGQRQYQATCAACHGTTGISIAPIYPDVAGQKEEYLVTQLKAFRDGTRKNPIMEPMAKGLTDSEIANLSLYLSQLGSPGSRPPASAQP